MVSAGGAYWWWLVVRLLTHTWERYPSIHARPIPFFEGEVPERCLLAVLGEESAEGSDDN